MALIRLFVLSVIFSLLFIQCGQEIPLVGSSGENEVGAANDIYSYSYNGVLYSWKDTNKIQVLLPKDADVTTSGYNSDLRTAAARAITVWQPIMAQYGISLEIIDSGTNDIKVIWESQQNLTNNVVGYATFSPNDSNGDTRKIIISTDSQGVNQVTANASAVFKIVLHEMGHILGVWSHSVDSEDIMYPRLTDNSSLSARDQATLKQLYNVEPDLAMQSLSKNSALTSTNVAEDFARSQVSSVLCALSADDNMFRFSSP